MQEPRAFRIFIASPSDVGEERAVALSIVRRLTREHEALLRVEPVFWEHEPLTAADGFQPQIGSPSACDVFVCIVWSRLGTPLPPSFAVRADGTSYPSGHASRGWMIALVLSDMVPEKANALLARGRDYGDSRVVCAEHFPSDVEAGRMVGAAVYAAARADPQFASDFAAAKSELRAALGL